MAHFLQAAFFFPFGTFQRGHASLWVINGSFVNYVSVLILFIQTCFVDCLIEQTHPEIRKRDDVDVSVHLIRSTLITHLFMAEEMNGMFIHFFTLCFVLF